ncbi:hypothetical protein M427DRAFT_391600 [Gonapodya prolifera JEL478]|uniref:TMC domain-containing protein n=1 Tax=Gonapodya prolifera (strain JEL478) TaxID=1344416 RepID=A0A139A7J4_GONPJ|nr:hypothetical protein M427DRAFT_391600 [Gonapodya prolifera JEL478]|eukprot:KXS12750.1 hypothetical protein M427DRAFT_391600 [Gonapodya prolifera JEL478]
MKKIFGRYEFDLPTNILELVYRQALIWVGTTYCPIIAILSVISSSLIFYIKYIAIMVWGDPPKELYSSSGQTNGFLIFMCLTLFLSASPVWYAITMLPPSCGPHLVNAFVTPFQYTLRMWDVIPAWIDTLPTAPRWALNFAGSAALTVPILIVLLLYAYYLRAVKEKQGQKLRELEAEVKAEREDKKFLMRFYKVQT